MHLTNWFLHAINWKKKYWEWTTDPKQQRCSPQSIWLPVRGCQTAAVFSLQSPSLFVLSFTGPIRRFGHKERNTTTHQEKPNMAELGAGSLSLGDTTFNYQERGLNERLRRLYPAVNEAETPLPRSWSPKDKYSYIGLSQSNLRVHYKGEASAGGSWTRRRVSAPVTSGLSCCFSPLTFLCFTNEQKFRSSEPAHPDIQTHVTTLKLSFNTDITV